MAGYCFFPFSPFVVHGAVKQIAMPLWLASNRRKRRQNGPLVLSGANRRYHRRGVLRRGGKGGRCYPVRVRYLVFALFPDTRSRASYARSTSDRYLARSHVWSELDIFMRLKWRDSLVSVSGFTSLVSTWTRAILRRKISPVNSPPPPLGRVPGIFKLANSAQFV